MRITHLPVALAIVGLVACSDALEPTREAPLAEGARIPGVVGGYRTLSLGTLGGASGSAQAINNRNEVVGMSREASGDLRAFLWRDGAMEGLEGLGGPFSGANDISDRGWIVGAAETAGGDVHAVLWRDGEPADLGTLGGSFSEALAVNSGGVVVGIAENGAGQFPSPFVWSRGQMRELPVPPGTEGAWAFGVNDGGDVVGMAVGEFPGPPQFRFLVALLWPKGGDVIVLDSPCQESAAFDVNNRRQIVGGALVCPISTDIIPVIWEDLVFSVLEPLGGLVEDLTLGLQNNGSTSAVSDRGQIVGFSDAAPSALEQDFAATLWHGGEPFELPEDFGARDINERGYVAGLSSSQPALLIPRSAPGLALDVGPGAPALRANVSGAVSSGAVSDVAGALSNRDWARRLCRTRGQVELAGPATAAAIMAGCP